MRSKVLISIISALIFAAVSTSGKAQQAANVILAQPDDEGQIIFDQCFETRTLRVDYLLGGDDRIVLARVGNDVDHVQQQAGP